MLAAAGLLLGTLPPLPAAAQPAPPPQAAPVASAEDPPARVGRLAGISGTVSFRSTGADHWDPATPNYPLTSDNAVWTEPQGSADIELGASRFSLDGGTEFDIDRLDDHALNATLGQGRLYLNLQDLAPGDSVQLRTPRGTVAVGQPGHYILVAGDASAPTLVTAVDGTAQVSAPGLSLTVGPAQTATITGSDHFEGSVGVQQADSFLAAQMARDRPPPAPVATTAAVAPPPEVMQMTGSDSLLTTGQWAQTPDYGPVWYPPASPGWVPYRSGHWVWVAPWGWTWVDDAPWGFAPFHYGRWAFFGGRWCWVPGVDPGPVYGVPVYAPALVSGVGGAAGGAVGLAIGAAVGWIPLGPREPFRPWYRSSPRYFSRINGPHGVNVANINNVNVFVNRNAGSFGTPGGVAGDPRAAGHWQAMTPRLLASARPVAQPPVRPSIATPGVTPAVARQVPLSPPPAGYAPRPAAPGPAAPARPTGNLPPLRSPGGGAPPAGPAAFHPGLPPLPPAGGAHPPPGVAGPATARPGLASMPAVHPPGPAPALTPHAMPSQPRPAMQHPLPPLPAAPHAAPLPAVQHPTPPAPVMHAPVPPPQPTPAAAFHAPPPAPPPRAEPPHPAPPPPHPPAGGQHHGCPPGHETC